MDVAELGFKISYGDVINADKALNKLVASAERVQAATGGMTAAIKPAEAALNAEANAAQKAAEKTDAVSSAAKRSDGSLKAFGDAIAYAVKQHKQAETAADKYIAKLQKEADEAGKTAAQIRKMEIEANASAAEKFGLTDQAAKIRSYGAELEKIPPAHQAVAKSAAYTANNVRNMAYQFIDVGQGLAMGQPVYMIAAQQLGQIGQIAAFSGMSVKQWAVEFGVLIGILKKVPAANAEVAASNIAVAESAAIASAANITMATTAGEAAAAESVALAPLAPVLLAVAAMAAVAGAGFLGVKSAANDAAKDDGFIKSLGLTDQELKKIGNTNVTVGDTFAGLGDMVGALWGVIDKGGTVTKTVGGAFSWLGDKIGTVVDWAIKEFQYFVANGVGSARAFLATWKEIPGAVGDIVISVANATIKGVEAMINATIGGINKLLNMTHLDGMFSLSNVSLGQLKNPFSGQAAKWGQDSAKEYVTGFNQAISILASAPGFAEARRNARLKAAADALRADENNGGANGSGSPAALGGKTADWLANDMSLGKVIPISQAYQLGRMPNDGVKSYLDQFGNLDSSKIGKLPELIDNIGNSVRGVGKLFAQAATSSQGFWSGMISGLQGLSQAYLQSKIDKLFSKIADWAGQHTSGSSGWFFSEVSDFFNPKPNAMGGVYSSPSLSAYSGHVYNTPQMFKFAKGAGVFAEAGPEAIMPLTRGSDGKLGVAAHGGGGAVYAPLIQFPLDGIVEPFRAAFSQMNDRLKAQQQDTLNKARKQSPGWSSYRSAYGSA